MKGVFAVAFLVYFLNSISFGEALQCYTCSTAIDAKCKDDVKSLKGYTCVSTENSCMVLTVKGIITRSCGAEDACKQYDGVADVSCKSCKTDLCNVDSGAFVPNFTVSLGIFAALYTSIKLLI